MLRLSAHKEIAISASPASLLSPSFIYCNLTTYSPAKLSGSGTMGWGVKIRAPAQPPLLEPNQGTLLEVIFYIVFRFYRAAFDRQRTPHC